MAAPKSAWRSGGSGTAGLLPLAVRLCSLLILVAVLYSWTVRTQRGTTGGCEDGSGVAFNFDDLATSASCPALNWTSIAFLHVPKAAGTAFKRPLHLMLEARGQRWCVEGPQQVKAYGFRFRPFFEQYPFECEAAPPEQHAWLVQDISAVFPAKCQGISTHLDLGLFEAMGVDFGAQLTAVNLRRPVDRLVSNFYYTLHWVCDIEQLGAGSWPPQCRQAQQESLQRLVDLVQSSSSLDDALQRYARHPLVRNRITQQLAGSFGCRWRGLDEAATASEPALLAHAKAALARFCLLLITEREEESMEVLAAAHGGPLPLEELPESNKLPHALPSPELYAELEAAQQLDNELYEFGLRLFDARLRQLRSRVDRTRRLQ